MAGPLQKDNEPIIGINVTPLVDVMLVLLIIFMVTANYIQNQAIKIELPKASTGETPDQVTNLAFVIDAQSTLYLDGVPFDLTTLPGKVSQLKAEGKTLQALIGADKNSRHGIVVELIDALRSQGVTDFALNIETKH